MTITLLSSSYCSNWTWHAWKLNITNKQIISRALGQLRMQHRKCLKIRRLQTNPSQCPDEEMSLGSLIIFHSFYSYCFGSSMLVPHSFKVSLEASLLNSEFTPAKISGSVDTSELNASGSSPETVINYMQNAIPLQHSMHQLPCFCWSVSLDRIYQWAHGYCQAICSKASPIMCRWEQVNRIWIEENEVNQRLWL